jgi:hypothetical protein
MTTFLLSRISVLYLLKYFQTICGPVFRAFKCYDTCFLVLSTLCMFRRFKTVHGIVFGMDFPSY